MVRSSVRKLGGPCRSTRGRGAAVHGVAVRLSDAPGLQHFRPNGGDPGGRLFAEDREPARRARHGARQDRRVPLPAAERGGGIRLLRPPLGRAARPRGDGVEGGASAAARPMMRRLAPRGGGRARYKGSKWRESHPRRDHKGISARQPRIPWVKRRRQGDGSRLSRCGTAMPRSMRQ